MTSTDSTVSHSATQGLVVDRSQNLGDLARRMAMAYGRVRNLEEQGWNAYQQFGFVSLGQITEPVRRALAEAGVAVMPSVVEHHEQDLSGKSAGGTRVTVTVDFMWIAAESGEFMTTRWVGSAMDRGDKASNKAYSAVLKQALQKTFLVSSAGPSSDDADYESPEGMAEGCNARAAGLAAPAESRHEMETRFQALLAEAALATKDVQAFQAFLMGVYRVKTWAKLGDPELRGVLGRLGSMAIEERRRTVLDKLQGAVSSAN